MTRKILAIFASLLFINFSVCAKNADDLTSEYFYIAESYAELKKYEKAIEFYKKTIKNEKYANAAHYNLGRMYAMLKRWDEAVAELQPLYEAEPKNQKILTAYAYVLSANGKLEMAQLLYKDIYEMNPESPTPAFNYVRILIAAKQYENAKELLKSLLEKFVEDEEREIIKTLTKRIEKLIDPLKDEKEKEELQENNEEEIEEDDGATKKEEKTTDETKTDNSKKDSEKQKTKK